MNAFPSALVALRLAASLLVGTVATALALPVLVAAAFGAWLIAVAGLLAVLGGSVLLLAAVHRGTGGTGSSAGWGAAVTLASTVVAALSAAAWEQAGEQFGRYPLLWAAACGGAFLLCSAALTRPTRVPGALGVAVLVTVAVTSLVPSGGLGGDQRGCIATSAEQAARDCP